MTAEVTMESISLHVNEPDAAQEIIGRFYYAHRLTVLHEPDKFAMTMSGLNLGPIAAALVRYSGEVRLDVPDELECAYQVNVPLSGWLRTRSGLAEVCATSRTAALYRPDGNASLHGWVDSGTVFGLKIERTALEARLADLAGRPVRGVIPFAPSLDVQAGSGRQWWSLTQSLAALAADPDGPLARPMVALPLMESVLTALLYATEHPYRDAMAAPSARAGTAAIKRAVDLLEGEQVQPWTVGDLAGRVGRSTRALQNGFARYTDTSPMSYLRQVRLQRADAELRAAGGADRSVASIASRWGFTNFGRFAAAYRTRYGCPPSETLRRAR
jgi:AraC-like DNA-binding protein